ncbi:AI-2E family transporter [Actinocrinis sp.]|uniref:AI-2E family transporter n=1 Tax=Actinocrinis sp. TaxID=1920516 RepID=UPI002B6C7960|nr:AI-2E family transporter [Actinocrinis sp.]HXR71857.1 AI-2E family transporter [Actinocrinis sp.]
MGTGGQTDGAGADDAREAAPAGTSGVAPEPAVESESGAAPEVAAPAEPAAAPASLSPVPAASATSLAAALPQRSYFTYAFGLAAGALSAYLLVRGIARAGGVITTVLLAAFLAVSLNPIVTMLTRQTRVPMRRAGAVLIVALGVMALVAGFLAVIVPPVATEVTALVHAIPHVLQQIQDRSTYLGRLEAKYHVVSKVQSALSARGVGTTAVSGIVGAGKYVLSTLTSTLAVVALTIYFLAGLPNIVAVAYRTVPASRRDRVRALGDEILTQVGRYMLGSALNASIAGLATYVWTAAWGIQYPAALGLLVALMDMIPVIGSTIGGAIVTLVALTVSVPVAIATLLFYIGFRLTEDYVLLPKVMRHAVDVPPIVTVVAVLAGGSLLGIIGALVAIPTAAALKLITVEVLIPRLDRR